MNASCEMPRYKSHKEVWALKIKGILVDPTVESGCTIVPADPGYGQFTAPVGYLSKHEPYAGGYYVQYQDGYVSFSPAEAFEAGYTPLAGCKFDSTDDQRTENNVMRHEYRVLTDAEKADIADIKDAGHVLYNHLDAFGSSRELSLAKTKIEEAVMWAVKHVTK